VTEVARAAPPNDLPPDRLRLRAGADGPAAAVDPAVAGWRYLSYRAVSLSAGETLDVGEDGTETAVVVLSGGGATVQAASGPALILEGRRSVWDGGPWTAYLPVGVRARLEGRPLGADERVTVAVAAAPGSDRADASRAPILITPDDITVEIRGAGNATRQIVPIIAPDFPADRLLLVEVYTPSGNWSSWPPHKHDVDDMPNEAVLEEIYHYQFRRPEAWAIQRLYRADGSRDALWAVRHDEVVLVTDGYHPFAATHGDDAYYLNALAGDRRTMACSFDPDLVRILGEWDGMDRDPRVPLVPLAPVVTSAAVASGPRNG
jgi:5-deoxy-glucuronate isomerase